MKSLLLALLPAAILAGADVTVMVEPRWQGVATALPTSDVRNAAGQTLRLTRLAALVSEVKLRRADGGVVLVEGQYGFIDAAAGRLAFSLTGLPDAEYAGLEFTVGLPDSINHADPGRWPAGHALNPVVNGLHWSWQGGCVFLALEGRWREGGAAADAAERGFSFHLATDRSQMPLRFAANFKVAGATTVRLAFDVGRVLGSHRLAADDGSESTHSAEGDALAVQLVRAVERAWFFLGAAPTVGRTILSPPMEEHSRVERRVRDNAPYLAPTPLAFSVPVGFPQPSLPGDNPLTVEGVALGEALFHDRRLSGNGVQSCASCHTPTRAFSDSVALSRGAEGQVGLRNAMPLFNLAWHPAFAWDGSQPRIRDQALAAMTNPIEMHGEPARVVATLASDEVMRGRFAAAFGSTDITADRIGLALEQYMLTLVSADSKFDRALRGAATLSDEEKEGFALFMTEYDPTRGRRGADCFHCHGGALFSDHSFKSNGLDLASLDAGRARVTGRDDDRGKFKTPSLRNVALTGPYMHDGRFATLEDVVAHYDHGVKRAAALDPNLAKHPDAGLQLTAAEQRALVAFLRALTDVALVSPPISTAVARSP